jgi:hypothetical protein
MQASCLPLPEQAKAGVTPALQLARGIRPKLEPRILIEDAEKSYRSESTGPSHPSPCPPVALSANLIFMVLC